MILCYGTINVREYDVSSQKGIKSIHFVRKKTCLQCVCVLPQADDDESQRSTNAERTTAVIRRNHVHVRTRACACYVIQSDDVGVNTSRKGNIMKL